MGRVCMLKTEKDLLEERAIGAELEEIIGESGRSEEASFASVTTCVHTSSKT